ncbi:hypothetical protein BCEP4_770016 [Burkholderia cepacia]|nr:hypothetical protein BCEP4_770016 [Burkholderia cepacia]
MIALTDLCVKYARLKLSINLHIFVKDLRKTKLKYFCIDVRLNVADASNF